MSEPGRGESSHQKNIRKGTAQNNMKHSHRFFENRECQYFPCHKGLKDFNCLFCYCPLYLLKDKCGGNFKYTKNGVKDCSACMLPHAEGGYDYVLEKIRGMN